LTLVLTPLSEAGPASGILHVIILKDCRTCALKPRCTKGSKGIVTRNLIRQIRVIAIEAQRSQR
jgi:hypothetical protein